MILMTRTMEEEQKVLTVCHCNPYCKKRTVVAEIERF
jgi:hypothetical protein